MPGLPFDILASSILTGQQQKSPIFVDSGEESVFSQNLELALESVLSEKGFQKGDVLANSPSFEAIKTLETLNFVELAQLSSLILKFEGDLAELANLNGLSEEEQEALLMSFWAGFMQSMKSEPQIPDQIKIQNFIQNFKVNKENILNNNEQIPFEQLQSMIQNIGKKQYHNDEVKVLPKIQTEMKPVGENQTSQKNEAQPVLSKTQDSNTVVEISPKQPLMTDNRAIADKQVTQSEKPNQEKVKIDLSTLKENSKNENKTIDVKENRFAVAKDSNAEVEKFRLRFMTKVRDDIVGVAVKTKSNLPPQMLKLVNQVQQYISQLNQKFNAIARENLSKVSHDLKIQFNSAQNAQISVKTPMQVAETEQMDSEEVVNVKANAKKSVEGKEELDPRFKKSDKSKVERGAFRMYTHAKPLPQTQTQALDLLGKYGVQNKENDFAVKNDFVNIDERSANESQTVKIHKTAEIAIETQRQPAEISKPQMTDAPKFNSDPARTAKLMQSVREHMRLWVDRKYTAMKVQVEPAELGKIQLKTVVEQGKIGVLLQAESAIAKEILTQNVQQMKEMLESMGLNVATFTVADFEEGDGSKFDQHQNKSSGKFDLASLLGEEEQQEVVQSSYDSLINRVA